MITQNLTTGSYCRHTKTKEVYYVQSICKLMGVTEDTRCVVLSSAENMQHSAHNEVYPFRVFEALFESIERSSMDNFTFLVEFPKTSEKNNKNPIVESQEDLSEEIEIYLENNKNSGGTFSTFTEEYIGTFKCIEEFILLHQKTIVEDDYSFDMESFVRGNKSVKDFYPKKELEKMQKEIDSSYRYLPLQTKSGIFVYKRGNRS